MIAHDYELKPVAGRHILYAMAADPEYGEHLRARFAPLMIGVGPVEAAINLTRTLADLETRGTLPDLVVSIGSAGSRDLEQTGIYQATSVEYRDMDASPLGFEKGATPFLDLPATLDLPHRIPGIAQATLSTGANIVTFDKYAQVNAQMVDMETFAVLRACQHFGLPLVALRGISDGAEELNNHISSWTEYLHIIDEKLAHAVDRVETALADGVLLKN